jgi:hypothetical protein
VNPIIRQTGDVTPSRGELTKSQQWKEGETGGILAIEASSSLSSAMWSGSGDKKGKLHVVSGNI